MLQKELPLVAFFQQETFAFFTPGNPFQSGLGIMVSKSTFLGQKSLKVIPIYIIEIITDKSAILSFIISKYFKNAFVRLIFKKNKYFCCRKIEQWQRI